MGYAALSLERVAGRAGVGKAALYRRWSSKLAFVADALETTGPSVTPIPDTGSLEGDVAALLRSMTRLLRDPAVRSILTDLHAECARGGDLMPLQTRLAKARRAQGEVVIDRAVERGELPATVDRELCLDQLAAPLYWRTIIVRGSCSPARLRRLTAGVLAALRAFG